MDISSFFEPVSITPAQYLSEEASPLVVNNIHTYTEQSGFPDVAEGSVVLFGVLDDRGTVANNGCDRAPNQIRSYLYSLVAPFNVEDTSVPHNVYDLGNILPGDTMHDTYEAVIQVMQYLLERNVVVVVLGGGQDISYAVYKAYEAVGRVINLCAVDPRLDIAFSQDVNSHSYVNHIVMQQPNFLFNYTVLGYQSYFVSPMHMQLMAELHFDAFRLGIMQEDMFRTEPLVRNADFVSVDLAAVRQSDAPANAHPSPHGFYGEQLCQIAHFAGMSDKLSCFGLFELNPLYDRAGQTAQMSAHAIWYFIEGFFNRKADFPYIDKQNYKQYLVQLETQGLEMVFYKSRKSDRWWVEVPCQNDELRQRYLRHLLIPCNYSDYERAMKNEISDLWWRYYQRLQW